jgi:site-specific DNA recombinase
MAKPTRCAIYTRKSTEEGLEQAFNSLDAQREACAAYILSQRHEGWTLVPELYDDGGYSGGNMDRPGLKQLLTDIRAGKVDVIVVYKVDRLTRSLADFAKMVEVLDGAGASFVSVTQAFNTTTSMGRLTLNVLLSFAQFEREVTGERIRDKIAASKAKGMWMGGLVPLGYDVQDRKLMVNEAEAETVRHIFARYLVLGSVLALHGDLDQSAIRSKARVTRTGRRYGDQSFSRGALYLMLQNRTYRGEVCHSGKTFAGEHDSIVDAELFDSVQAQLERNRVARQSGVNTSDPSLLAGLLWDGEGRRMTPSHASKSTKRYRYYVSQPGGSAPAWRVPAGDLEQLVLARIGALLRNGNALHGIACDEDAVLVDALLLSAKRLARQLEDALPHDRRTILLTLVQRIIIRADVIELALSCDALLALTGGAAKSGRDPFPITVPARLVRGAREVRIAVPPEHGGNFGRRDTALIKLVTKAHQARGALNAAGDVPFDQLARQQGYTRDYFAVLVRLSFLAPDITAAILDGRQPIALSRQRLARTPNLPFDWQVQRQLLGVAQP